MPVVNNMNDWLALGIERHWCSDIVCDTHGGRPPLTAEEHAEFETGDPCVPIVRLYEQDDRAVRDEHARK